MPKLRNMLGETGIVEIPVPGDEPLIVHYRRGALTPRLQSKMLAAQRAISQQEGGALADGDTLTAMCEMYAAIIEGWNLTDDIGSVIGTDAESLADVETGILAMVMQAIGKAVSPDPLSERDSSNGLSPMAVSEPRLIGMASS